MARSWSNRKTVRPAPSLPPRHSGNSRLFLVLLTLAILLFGGLVAYTFVRTQTHPLREVPQAASDRPQDD